MRKAERSEEALTREDVTEALRRDIVFGRLRPRERLLEGELTERFGVGRYVVRAALDSLARMGLVQQRPNRGAVISDYSREEVDALYAMRTLLQAEAARCIPLPAAPDLVRKLKDLNSGYLAAIEAGDLPRAAEANDQFHSMLFSACGNRFLAADIEGYWQKTASIHCYAIGLPDTARQSVREHEIMIQALREGDRETLVRMCVDHMRPALEAFRKVHGGWGH